MSTCTAVIEGLDAPSCTIGTIVNVDCNGNATGSFVVTGMGGNSMDYSFTDGVTTNTDGVFSNLVAGNYVVTVSEQANPMCTSTCSIDLAEPAILTCSTTLISDVSCNGLSDGSASVTVVGGTTAYTFAWDNGETTATATMLNACLLYTSPSPRDRTRSRMPSSA